MTIQTLPFSNLLSIDRTSATPLFRQLANALTTLIRNGKIQPGHQLPPSREMTAMAGLNRTTIIAAYDELRAQGWLEVNGKKGMFVAKDLPLVDPKSFRSEAQLTSSASVETDFYQRIEFDRPPFREVKPYHLIINDGYPDQRIAPLHSISNRFKMLLGKAALHGPLLTGNSAGSRLLKSELADFLSKTIE